MSGFLTHHGLALEGPITTPTWPTPAAALTRLLPWLSATMTPFDVFESVEVFGGDAGTQTLTPVARPAAVEVTYPLLYSGQETLLACALGYAPRIMAGTTYPVAIGSGVYRHRLELVNQLRQVAWPAEDGIASLLLRRLTVVFGTPVEVYEVQSGMITGWQLTADASGMSLAMAYLGALMETETPVNTWTTVTALAPPMDADIEGVDLVCRFGPLSPTTPLDDTHLLDVTSVTLQCQRPWRIDQSLSSGYAIAEPSCTGGAVLTGSLTVPSYTAREHGLLAASRAQTPYTLWLDASGPLVGSTPLQWRLWAPACHLTAVQRPWNANAPTATIPFTLLAPPSVPTWLAPVRSDGRLVVELVTTTATHALLGV